MQVVKIFVILALSLGFSGCTSSTRLLLTDNMPKRPTKLQDIMVYMSGTPIKSRPLAILSIARRGENSVWAVEAMKEEAAELGADAITNLDITYSTGILPELRVSGLAVKYVVK